MIQDGKCDNSHIQVCYAALFRATEIAGEEVNQESTMEVVMVCCITDLQYSTFCVSFITATKTA